MNRRLMDYNPEGEGIEGEVLLFGATPPPPRTASGEVNELELATAFLDAGSPCSLGALVNRLMRYASLESGRPINPDVARALAPRLRRAGSIVGGLLRTRKVTRPGGRTRLATSAAERAFGTELEGLSSEDKEFETARYFIRFALGAARAASTVPAGRSPAMVAAIAEKIAARRYAPGLVGTITPAYPGFRLRRVVRRSSI
jgi:hypothetical protein